jgi:hypothetical protein
MHKLNMELDLQSLFGLHVHSCSHWLRPATPPPPPLLGLYTRALLVSQDRQHLFVAPWFNVNETLQKNVIDQLSDFIKIPRVDGRQR